MPPEPQQPLHVVADDRGRSSPGSELARLRNEISSRNRQELAIAELGQAALTGVDPYIILGQACALVELTLGVNHCRALEINPTGAMRVRASIGSNNSFLSCAYDEEEDDSIGMVTLLGDGPLVFSDLRHETRFKGSHLREFHGIRSGAAVVVRTQYGPFGVIVAYAVEERVFEEFELAFLKSTANIVGEALTRGRTEHELRKSESRLKQLIASTLDAVVTIDRTATVIEWNPQAEATFGIVARDVIGRPLPREIVPPRFVRLIDMMLDRVRKGGTTGLLDRRLETMARHASGEEFPVEISIDPVGTGADQTFTAFIRDISERRRAQRELERRERRFRAIVEKSWSGVALLDADFRLESTGSSTRHLLGYEEEDLVGRSLFDLVHPRERANARRTFGALMTTPAREAHGELRFLRSDGTWVWLEGFAQNMLDDPSVGAIVLNYRDVTQRKLTEKQLEYRAYYDALTGLPNRLLFRDRVVNAIEQARSSARQVAVMYLDLDHFKLVNDGLGHTFGDTLLSEVARRLQRCLRPADTISRTGGDEFSVLVTDFANSEEVAGMARRMLDALRIPVRLDGNEIFISASIGISLFPADGDDVETLFRCADGAMFRAKELGRNQSQLFTAALNDRYARRLALEQSLHHAVEREELVLYYQPVYDRARRRFVSVEALVRWQDPKRGLVGPDEFITLAEETGMIIPIGAWVLRTACAQMRQWHEQGFTSLRVAVNISAPQLLQPDLIEMVAEALASNGLEPGRLQLEITESMAIQNLGSSMAVLKALRDMGVGIAVDDFGTGQSSLVYLKQFPIDTIKIDKGFLRDVASDETAAAIVSYVINLAHTMRLSVVAEGVETEEQYTFLRHYACDLMQGYLFSRPIPGNEIPTFLRSEGRPHTVEMKRP